VFEVRAADEGRKCLAAVVSDEETIRGLDIYSGYLARLAVPRGLSPEQASHAARS
jgi:hypothetical protein